MSRRTRVRRGRLAAPAVAIVLVAVVCGTPTVAASAFDYADYHPYEARLPALTSTVGFGTWDHFAVLVDANGTVQVYDITVVTQPRLTSTGFGFARIEHVAMSGRYLLIGGQDYESDPSQVALFELRDDGTLRGLAQSVLQEPGGHFYTPRGFATWGDLCFYGGYRDFGVYPNLFISRMSSGGAAGVGLVQGPGWPLAMAMKDNRLFVASANLGIAWFDFSPEGAILAEGNLGFGLNCRALDIAGDLLVAVEPDGTLDLVDVGASGDPVTISRTALGGAPAAVKIHGDVVLLADAYLGVRRVNVAVAAAPVVVDTLFTTAGSTAVAGVGPYVLAASRRDGVEVIDPTVSRAAALQFSVPWITDGFARHGSFVFGAGIVDGHKCAVLADISDPHQPRLVGSSPLAWVTDMWVTMADSLALIGFPYFGQPGTMLYKWDATRGLVAAVDVGGPMAAGAISGSMVYLAFHGGVSEPGIIRVRDACGLPVLGRLPDLELDMQPGQLVVEGSLLWCAGWLAGGGSGLWAYDIGEPANPQLRGRNKLPGQIYGMTAAGDALCTWGFSYTPTGVRLYDVSRPDAVTVLSELPGFGGVMEAALDGGHALLATREGLAVMSVVDPRAPRLLGAAAGPLPHVVAGDGVFLASGAGGLIGLASPGARSVAAVSLPRAREPALALWPNPFNPQLNVDLTVDRPGQVDVTVFDVRGRRVAGLFAGRADAGSLVLVWGGMADAGSAAPSGAYFVQAMTPTGVVTRKAVLVR
ncbi:MAG: T9SS type A sorting domain-containing protein [bacterium]|nr:T9SS type A sorting domain-containing protein [bacterium]